jgi:CDGSH-type Zn-finger protein
MNFSTFVSRNISLNSGTLSRRRNATKIAKMTAAQCGAEIEDIQLCTCGQSASHPFCDKSHLLVNASTGRQFSPVALAALQKHAAETKTDGLSTHDLLVVHAAARRCASGRRPKLNDALEHNRAVLSAARRRDVDEVLVKSANKENNDVAAVAADLCQDPLCDRQSSTSSTNSGVAAVVADVTEVDDSSSPSVPTRHRPRRHHRRQRHEQPTAAMIITQTARLRRLRTLRTLWKILKLFDNEVQTMTNR